MTELGWTDDGQLRLRGTLPAGVAESAAAAADGQVVLRHLDGWDIRAVRPRPGRQQLQRRHSRSVRWKYSAPASRCATASGK